MAIQPNFEHKEVVKPGFPAATDGAMTANPQNSSNVKVRLSVQETRSTAGTCKRTSDDAEDELHNGPDKHSNETDQEPSKEDLEDLNQESEERNAQEYLLIEMQKTVQNIRDQAEMIWEVLSKIPQCLYRILLVLLNVLLLGVLASLGVLQFLGYVLILTWRKCKTTCFGIVLFALIILTNIQGVVSPCEGWFHALDFLNQTLIIHGSHNVCCVINSLSDTPKTYPCKENKDINIHILNKTCLKVEVEKETWPGKEWILEFGKGTRGESVPLERFACSNSSSDPTVPPNGSLHTVLAIVIPVIVAIAAFVGLWTCLRKSKCVGDCQGKTADHVDEETGKLELMANKVWNKGSRFICQETEE